MNHAFALNANVWLIVAGALIVASWWTIVILGRTSGTLYHLNNWMEEKTHEMGEYFSLRFAWLGMIHDMIRFLIKIKYWSMTMRHAWLDDKLVSTSYAMYNFDEWNFENEPNNNNKNSLIATIYKTHLGLRLGKKVPTIGRHFRRWSKW